MTKQRHDSDVTRAELLTSGRQAFAEHGYTAAKTGEIVGQFGLTRGALYHHFDNKQGLFEAVVEQLQQDLTEEVNRRAASVDGDALQRLRAGTQAYLDFSLRSDARRILMTDGPAVLGWERWRDIDVRYAFGATRAGLQRAVDDGLIDDAVPVDELTHLLLGAITQAGIEIGRAAQPQETHARYTSVIDFLVNRLRSEPALPQSSRAS
ncbi:MAG: TetR/AcrR family transcriptional regulator [Actinomycetota bacterium]